MRNRSSIFGFDTLQEPPWPSKSFYVAAAIVLLSTILMHGFREPLMVRDPDSRLANAIRYLRSQEGVRPWVLFFGSSRTQSCIDAETFARESGLSGRRVLNLAQPAWGAWQALVVLRHAPDALSEIKTAFVEIIPDQFNENVLHPVTHKPGGNPEEFDVWASYAERLQPRDTRTRGKLLAECALPLAQRRNLIAWLKIGGHLTLRTPWKGEMSPPVYQQDAGKLARLSTDSYFEARTISRYHLHDYRFSHKEAAVFRQLLTCLRERGIEVVVFHPPVRAPYFDYVASSPRIQSEFGEFRSFVRDLAREYRVVYWETLDDSGLDNTAVVDYGHFSREGALRFTQRLHEAVNGS